MKDEQNNFYTSISKYYSEIFPYNPMQLKFVNNSVGNLINKHVLDIGCATGELAFNLAKDGAIVTGIDLNEDLLNQAKNNKQLPNLQFQIGNMLELESDFQKEQFDAILCFGNTLVHLSTTELIQQMLNGVKAVLKPGGLFLMQILNYDYILKEKVSALPLIETNNIKFIRKYKFNVNSPLIRFQTDLYLKNEEQNVSNETSLYGLESSVLVDMLANSGFRKIELYSNFKQSAFGGNHIPLILKGTVM
jgi:glycine/sarcosine N-methyltransferase